MTLSMTAMRRARVIARRSSERGMTMIELLISMTVLAVGVSGILALVLLAMAVNTRSARDTTGTVLAQLVTEQIQAQPANAVGNLTVQDCSGANRTITLAGAAGNGAGATLLPSGQMDWSQAPALVTAGYQMNYSVCTPSAGANQWMVYDVRWNLKNQAMGSSTIKIVTVSARPAAAQFGGVAQFKNYSLPVTLRTIVGN